MIFSIKSLGPLLLVGAAIASQASIPAARRFRSGGLSSYKSFTAAAEASAATLGTYEFTNWAGAFLEGTAMTGVTGTFVVPQPSVPLGGNEPTYCGCAWIGLDGISNFCPNGGLFQAGVNWCIDNTNTSSTSFSAWHEWYPAVSQQFWDDITISAGDSITVTIVATSTTGGTATLTNNSTGQVVSFTYTDEYPALCEVNAEWIVEDFSVDYTAPNELVPFADYGSVTFTDNSAVMDGIITSDMSQSYIINMISQSNSSDVISASTVNGNDITVVYQ